MALQSPQPSLHHRLNCMWGQAVAKMSRGAAFHQCVVAVPAEIHEFSPQRRWSANKILDDWQFDPPRPVAQSMHEKRGNPLLW